jgi:uncharacterized protein YbjT (DUF2867 family)
MSARNRIAVAGATGTVGRHVVDVLEARGHDVVAISLSSGVDLIKGIGLEKALSGVEFVVDASSSPSETQEGATKFFASVARNLDEFGSRAGVRRIVVVSIIGVDHFRAGYMAAKLAHERAAQSGSIPVRILRSAQFHELVPRVVGWGRQGEVSYVPKMRVQLVAARTAAEALADLATAPEYVGDPIPEVAGPREEDLADAARRLVARRGEHVRIEQMKKDPSDPDRELLENGATLPGKHARLAGPTFQEWLDAG